MKGVSRLRSAVGEGRHKFVVYLSDDERIVIEALARECGIGLTMAARLAVLKLAEVYARRGAMRSWIAQGLRREQSRHA